MNGELSDFGWCRSTLNALLRFLLLASLICPAWRLAAQTSLSTIRGTVTDVSGAPMAGVTVSAEEIATEVTARSIETDNFGNYEMPGLKQSTYRVRFTIKGFKAFVADQVVLDSNQTLRIDATMQVGQASAQITVSDTVPVIETEEGKISSEFNARQYKSVPIPGNAYSSPLPVLATLPNVQSDEGSYNVSFAGQTGAQLDMGMDGIKEETMNTQTVNMEAVEQVKVVVVNNSAEFSRVGYYNVVTKHGANDFHGEGSYYHRNSALGARGFFEPEKAHVIYHTMTGSLSGPIIRNRTFFYFLWNRERVPGGAFHLSNVPTTAMRNGDFSQLLTGDNPVTIVDPTTGQPFAANVIPQNRLNATALKLQQLYLPTPNLGGAGALANNFGFTWPYPDDQFSADVYTTRIDHQFSDKNSIYGRFSSYLPEYILAGDYPSTFWTRKRQSYSFAIVDTHILSPRVVNTFTFGGNRDRVADGDPIGKYAPLNGSAVVSELGLTGVNPTNLSAMGFPGINITGYAPLTVQPGGITDARNFTGADSIDFTIGRHVLKAGGELRTYRNFDGSVPADTYGGFTFNGSLTNNAYADFLLGLPYSSQRLTPLTNRVMQSKELGLFITDSFKVSSRLTLDVGVRWDYFWSPVYADGLQYNWDPTTGNVIVPQKALAKVSPLYPKNIMVVAGQVIPDPSKTNIAPRLSAAYRLTSKTVLRGGYGIFTEALGPYVLAQGSGPFQLGETFYNNGASLFGLPNPFPSGVAGEVPSQSVSGYPIRTKNGRIHQFNVSLEQQFKDIGFRLSYVGSRNRGMNYGLSSFNLGSFSIGGSPNYLELDKPQPSLTPFTDASRPYPQFVSASYDRNNGESNYNSLSLEVQRRVGRVTFDGSWTWAHNMVNYLNLENPYEPLLWNRDANPNHRLVINAAWDLPVGRKGVFLQHAPPFVDTIVGGWQLYWVGFFQSGHYFTPYYSSSDPSNTNTFGGLPDRIRNGNLPSDQRTLDHWFDTSAFVVPQAGRFGNSGANILEGPGLQVQNLSLSKRFSLTERLSLQLQGMASNLFNHPNFYSPPSDISVPGTAGVIGAGGGQHGFFSVEKSGPRTIELRARIEF